MGKNVFDARVWKATAACLVLASCTPASRKSGDDAHAQIEIKRDRLREMGLTAADGGDASLPDKLCYAVHVTGNGLEQVNAEELSCGPSTGLGVMTTRAYNKGDTAEITLKVGEKRRFDLIGFESPLGTQDGRAVCGDLTVEYQRAEKAIDRKILLKVNGQLVLSKPVLFATGEATIEPGNNIVPIQAIPLVSAPITKALGLAFGAPYNRSDASSVPQACVATFANPNKIFTPTSAAVAAPVTSLTGGRRLRAVSGTSFLMPAPKGSVNAARRELATGALEIRSRAGR